MWKSFAVISDSTDPTVIDHLSGYMDVDMCLMPSAHTNQGAM